MSDLPQRRPANVKQTNLLAMSSSRAMLANIAALTAVAIAISSGGAGSARVPSATPQPIGNSQAVERPSPLESRRPSLVKTRSALAPPQPAIVRPASRNEGAQPPLAPPNGTYVYAIARDGADQGKSTVVVFRRAATRTIEVNESLAVGKFRAHVLSGFAYETLLPNALLATYQAPFPPSSLLGAETRFRPRVVDGEQTTVRYDFSDAHSPIATIDGVQGAFAWPMPSPDLRSPLTGLSLEPAPAASAPAATQFALAHRGTASLDGPVMSGWAMLPAWLRKSGATSLTPVGAAFPEYVSDVRVARIALPPKQKKTPRTVIAKRIGDFATVWFDPQSQIVYELHLDSLNLDMRLLSYSKVTTPAPFEPEPVASAAPQPESTVLNVSVDGNVALSGILEMPSGAKKSTPAIVLIAPPAGDEPPTRNYGGGATHSLFASIAAEFLKRGYAIARYDARGVGKSGGSYSDLTWEQSLDDASAVAREVQAVDGIDSGRVFVLGYGAGADLAFSAASDVDNKIAGVIALGPTVVSYREALHRQFVNAQTKPEDRAAGERAFEHELKRLGKADAPSPSAGATPMPSNDGVWYKSALAHDPAALAARIVVPAFVLHGASLDPARTSDDVQAFDDRLRGADSLATIVVASDLSSRFGGRYDADAPENTEAIFPYSFDASTAGAIGDWLDGIRAGMRATGGNPSGKGAPRAVHTPPAPPPLPTVSHSSSSQGLPTKRKPIDDALPGQVTVPSTLQMTPPPSPPATPTPSPAPTQVPAQAPTLSPPAPHGT